MNKSRIQKIQMAHKKAAFIVAKYGPKYLPIFERLDHELARLQREHELYQKALDIGTRSGTQNGTPNGTQKDNH